MIRLLILITCFFTLISVQAQTSMGLYSEFKLKPFGDEKNAFSSYINFGVLLKSKLSKRVNFVSGLSMKFYNADVEPFSKNSDLVTYLRNKNNQSFVYVESDYISFEYLTLPIGIEYKITRFLRLQYRFENNFLIGTNDDVEDLQYGKAALSSYMYTHNITSYFFVSGFGIGIGVTSPPSVFKDQTYSYNFMYDMKESLHNTYMLNFILSYDFPLIKRKKIL